MKKDATAQPISAPIGLAIRPQPLSRIAPIPPARPATATTMAAWVVALVSCSIDSYVASSSWRTPIARSTIVWDNADWFNTAKGPPSEQNSIIGRGRPYDKPRFASVKYLGPISFAKGDWFPIPARPCWVGSRKYWPAPAPHRAVIQATARRDPRR